MALNSMGDGDAIGEEEADDIVSNKIHQFPTTQKTGVFINSVFHAFEFFELKKPNAVQPRLYNYFYASWISLHSKHLVATMSSEKKVEESDDLPSGVEIQFTEEEFNERTEDVADEKWGISWTPIAEHCKGTFFSLLSVGKDTTTSKWAWRMLERYAECNGMFYRDLVSDDKLLSEAEGMEEYQCMINKPLCMREHWEDIFSLGKCENRCCKNDKK
jgi:hypothetical protein